MGFPRQEYWSGLQFTSPGDLPDLEIKPVCPALADGFFPVELLREALICYVCVYVYRCMSIYIGIAMLGSMNSNWSLLLKGLLDFIP